MKMDLFCNICSSLPYASICKDAQLHIQGIITELA